MDDKTFYTLIVTVLLAFLGIVAKYWNDLRVAQRKDRLERVTSQLRDLYGPLYALDQAGLEAWQAFRSRVRPGGPFFDPGDPPSSEELEAWRLWMTEVFMPMNLRMEAIITGNMHLLRSAGMPQVFKDFCAHVAAYKPVLRQWAQGNFEEHLSVFPYPPELRAYMVAEYSALTVEQQRLLGLTHTGTG